MEQFEKVCNGLDTEIEHLKHKSDTATALNMSSVASSYEKQVVICRDALALIRQQQERIKAQDEVIQALRKVGCPHNFQREPTWIVNYMYAITDVIKKAVKLE